MKILLTLIFVILLITGDIYAETSVTPSEIPQDPASIIPDGANIILSFRALGILPPAFQLWSYSQYQHCEVLGASVSTSLYGTFQPDTKEVLVVTITEVGRKTVLISHGAGPFDNNRFMYGYLPGITGSKQYNMKEPKERDELEKLLIEQLVALVGPYEEIHRFMTSACTPVNKQISSFVTGIFQSKRKVLEVPL